MRNMLWILLALFVMAFAVPVFAQPEVPADGLKMELTKKPVVFNHSTHSTIECGACHHPVDGKENYQSCASASCHDDLKAKKGTNSYYFVLHAKKGIKYDTCVSCHAKAVAEGKGDKKELTSCAKSKCHP